VTTGRGPPSAVYNVTTEEEGIYTLLLQLPQISRFSQMFQYKQKILGQVLIGLILHLVLHLLFASLTLFMLAVPGGPPQNMTADVISYTQILLLWKSPLSDIQNGHIRSYANFCVRNSNKHFTNL